MAAKLPPDLWTFRRTIRKSGKLGCSRCYSIKGELMSIDIEKYLIDLESSDEEISSSDIDTLCGLAESSDSLVRSRVASLLADHYDERSVDALLKLADDSNRLVRTEAADSLYIAKSQEVFDKLADLAQNDPYYLVRGYAVMSLFYVYINMYGESMSAEQGLLKTLLEYYEKEDDDWVLVSYYKTFYECGDKTFFQNLIDSMTNPEPDIRGITVQAFMDILSSENKQIIKDTVFYYYQNEDDGLVRPKMEELLNYIDKYEWEDEG